MKKDQPTILVIFGISGDLARRYLLPAIEAIADAKMLPEEFRIVGLSRQENLKKSDLIKNHEKNNFVSDHLEILTMNVADKKEYEKLDRHLEELEKKFSSPSQRIFYMSVPSEACSLIVEMLGVSDLNKKTPNKLLLEKPFGVNLVDARSLADHIDKYFKEEEVYRIDHYLAKEAAQNIIVFRDGNSLFKKTWNRDFIDSIEIIASESIGIEGRAHFYEQTGALRDYVQSHLLQLLALVLMNLPRECDLGKVSSMRLDALKSLSVLKEKSLRGQYDGYKDEVKNSDTKVETFVSVTLKSSDPKWEGVPMTVCTGKALESRFTEIRINYKKNEEHESNELIFRLQPDAGVKFSIWAKKPGYERELSSHVLHFSFKDHYENLPEAYEQVLFNAINGDHSLFTSSEEVLEGWRILDEVQKSWEHSSGEDLIVYKKGSDFKAIINKSEEN